MRNLFLLALLLFIPFCSAFAQESTNDIRFTHLSELSSPTGQPQHGGIAGAFSAIYKSKLFVAGGMSFVNTPSQTVENPLYFAQIYMLDLAMVEAAHWKVVDTTLPRALANGLSIPTDDGILCIGGWDGETISDQVCIIHYDEEADQVSILKRNPLPTPLAFMTGGSIGNQIYVAGGKESDGRASSTFLNYDMQKDQWLTLDPWPGPPRISSVSAIQSDGDQECFFLFSGQNFGLQGSGEFLTDAYKYEPAQQRWSLIAGPEDETGKQVSLTGGSGVAAGANHILVFGGIHSRSTNQPDSLVGQILANEEPLALPITRDKALKPPLDQVVFSDQVLAYHSVTNSWINVGGFSSGLPIATQAHPWDNTIIIPGGEIKPGSSSAAILSAEIRSDLSFGWINFLVIAAYLLVLVGMGIYFSKKEKTTEDYFKAGGRIPWWAAGLSIFGTQLSAITFMAIPAKAYATDWSFFMFNMTIIMIAPVVIYVFLPFYRRLDITTAYQYLEMRFNLAARIIGAMMLILLQFGRIGIVLFLPSIALSIVTGIDVSICILVMGILSIIYTVLGGIEAVIWTDVLQVVVLLGGALVCMILIFFSLDGDWSSWTAIASSDHKFELLDFRFDWTQSTFWVVILGGLGASLISYGSDQVVVQRYMTTKDEKSAARSIWLASILSVPTAILFFALGTALYLFYQINPIGLDLTIENPDAILPYFIVSQLPPGVAGLLIAGIFAAAMSSLDSSMNSVATVITTDFYERFSPKSSEHHRLLVAKWTTAIVGITGTVFALFMATWDIKSLWDQLNTFIGLFAGGLGGLFLLGICTRRAHGLGAVLGLVSSGFVQFFVKEYTTIHFFMYTVSGILTCFTVGYIASLLFRYEQKNLDGLTIHSI